MKEIKINVLLTVLTIFFSFLFISQALAQNSIDLEGLTLIQSYNNYEDLHNQYKEQLDVQQTIVIEDDKILFFGDNSDNPVKTIEKVIPSFTEDDIKAFNTANKTKRVSRKEYFYEVIENSVLHVTLRNVLYNTKDDISRSELISSVLYNCSGEIIGKFGNNINQIITSPYNLRFVATRTGVNPSDTLYFFNMNGQFIKSVYFQNPVVSFTKGGKYVKVKKFGNNILSIYTADGAFLFSTNTWNDHNVGLVFSSFVVDAQHRLLLSTCLPKNQLSYIDFDNQLLWKQQMSRVLDVVPMYMEENLLVFTLDDQRSQDKTKKSIYIISLSNGEEIDSCENCNLIKYFDNKIIIEKGGVYYVFEYR